MVEARKKGHVQRRVRAIGAFWILSLAAPRAFGACPASPVELEARLAAGVQAFEDMDAGAFEEAWTELREDLTCPTAPLGVPAARQVHLVAALNAHLGQQSEQARAAFRAVRATDPAWALPMDLAPRGNLLRKLFDEATPDPAAATVALATPSRGAFHVDGRPATRRPTDRPFLLQWVDGGKVLWSDYLPAGAHLPMSLLASLQDEDPMAVFKAGVPDPVKPVAPVPVGPAEPAGPRIGAGPVLLGSAGAVAVAAGGLTVAALVARRGWQDAVDECVLWDGCAEDPDAAMVEHDRLAGRARALGYAAQGTAGVALGLGAVGVVLLW